MKLFLFITALLVLQYEAASLTRLDVWTNHFYIGTHGIFNDLDSVAYGDLSTSNWKDKVSSFKIVTGSCVEFFDKSPPNYSEAWAWTTEVDFSSLAGTGWNDKIDSVKSCGKYRKSMTCPSGTFVRRVKWDTTELLQNGFELHCYLPRSKTPHTILSSHGASSLNGNRECVGMRAMDIWWDQRRHAVKQMGPLCNGGFSSNSTQPNADFSHNCRPGYALASLDVDIEYRSGFIKDYEFQCRDAGNIAEICPAHDKLNVLLICDAANAQYPLTCSHAKTVGYGNTTSFTEELRNEYTFYEEFGFEMGFAAFGLSTNFKTNLGYSETTGYSWATTSESTFHEEVTITVEAEAPAGCVTTVTEVIGECLFMQTRPNYFQRTDKCKDNLFLTDVVIPDDFNTSQIFVSKIPEKVLKHLDYTNDKASGNHDILGIYDKPPVLINPQSEGIRFIPQNSPVKSDANDVIHHIGVSPITREI